MPVVAFQPFLEQRDDLRRADEIRVDIERASEELERAPRIAELQVDLPGAGQRTEMLRVALEDLVAIAQGVLEAAEQEVDRRALVPAFRETGLAPHDLVER